MGVEDTSARVAWGKVIARCWRDDDYKANLLADPRTVLTEAGLDVPDGIDVKVQEQVPGQRILTIPAPPDDEDMELDDHRLEAAAGGGWDDWGNCWC